MDKDSHDINKRLNKKRNMYMIGDYIKNRLQHSYIGREEEVKTAPDRVAAHKAGSEFVDFLENRITVLLRDVATLPTTPNLKFIKSFAASMTYWSVHFENPVPKDVPDFDVQLDVDRTWNVITDVTLHFSFSDSYDASLGVRTEPTHGWNRWSSDKYNPQWRDGQATKMLQAFHEAAEHNVGVISEYLRGGELTDFDF